MEACAFFRKYWGIRSFLLLWFDFVINLFIVRKIILFIKNVLPMNIINQRDRGIFEDLQNRDLGKKYR